MVNSTVEKISVFFDQALNKHRLSIRLSDKINGMLGTAAVPLDSFESCRIPSRSTGEVRLGTQEDGEEKTRSKKSEGSRKGPAAELA